MLIPLPRKMIRFNSSCWLGRKSISPKISILISVLQREPSVFFQIVRKIDTISKTCSNPNNLDVTGCKSMGLLIRLCLLYTTCFIDKIPSFYHWRTHEWRSVTVLIAFINLNKATLFSQMSKQLSAMGICTRGKNTLVVWQIRITISIHCLFRMFSIGNKCQSLL